MRFALMIEPQQGLTYDEQLAIARRAEGSGFEALFRSDHFTSFPGPQGRPTTDAWAVVAGLARDTRHVRLGVLVSPVTFRLPGQFAKLVTTVDEMSGGRIEVGVGAGWNEVEHRRFGLPFPPIGERADWLEDELAILHGLWEEPDGWSFEGHRFRIEDATFQPKPVQRPHPPVIVGSEGSPRSLRLAARWADEFNLSSSSAEVARDVYRRLDEACRSIGRDPASIRRSVMAGVLVGRDEEEFRRRTNELIEFVGADSAAEAWLDERRKRWVIGTPEQARERVREFAAAGAERLMLQDLLPRDDAMIALLGEELVGRV